MRTINVDILDFLVLVARNAELLDQVTAIPIQNRVATANALSDLAKRAGYHIPREDFFSILNVQPKMLDERDWAMMTSNIDMASPIDAGQTVALTLRIQVIVERLRIKAHSTRSTDT